MQLLQVGLGISVDVEKTYLPVLASVFPSFSTRRCPNDVNVGKPPGGGRQCMSLRLHLAQYCETPPEQYSDRQVAFRSDPS